MFAGLQEMLERFKGDEYLDKPLSALQDICFELVEPNMELRMEAERMKVSMTLLHYT